MTQWKWSAFAALVAAVWFAGMGCSDGFKDVQRADVGEAIKIDEPDAADKAEAATDGAARAYALTSDSSIVFEGSKVVDTRVGGFSEFEGTIVVPDGDPEKARIEVTIDMDSIYSDSSILTRVLRDKDFFDVENHATASFVSTGIEKEGDDRYRITGNLTIRGVAKSVTFTAQASEVSEGALGGEAEFVVDRTLWNVGYDSWEGQLIKNEVKLALYVVAKAQ